jgi:peptidoglycan/xylan/chitin deacetylase (PgdA/CDA1 family)
MPAQVVRYVYTMEKIIALTFDDEGTATRIKAILSALDRANAHATMFLNGFWIEKNKELVRRMDAAGHEIANHSYSHRNFTMLEPVEIQRELARTNAAIAAAGVRPGPLFRPPYGSINLKVLYAAGNAGFTYAVLWSIDTKDWEGRSAGQIAETVLSQAKPGAIVLFHLHGENTAAALPGIIAELKSKGYSFVTVSQLIAGGTPVGL